MTISRRGLLGSIRTLTRHLNHQSSQSMEVDEKGQPYNEMDALPFNQRPGVKEEPDWCRRVFVAGYMGGTAVFFYLIYYKPDVSVETWAWNVAKQQMQERGVDMFWLDKANFAIKKDV